MSFDEDDDILQDFLVEAGEILDLLSEQLIELEQRPSDVELLNAIFRGFHTVKGSAGFLHLEAMVACCHRTENLFDILRNGQSQVSPDLMDVVLKALDTLNAQFQEVADRKALTPATPALLKQLDALVKGSDLAVERKEAPNQASTPAEPESEFSDEEFEGFLDAIDKEGFESSGTSSTTSAKKKPSADKTPPVKKTSLPGPADESETDVMDEEEFERLLDELHGEGKAPGTRQPVAQSPETGPSSPAVSSEKSEDEDDASSEWSDEMSESEFESLLDELHGEGKAPSGKAPKAIRPEKQKYEPANPVPNDKKDSVEEKTEQGLVQDDIDTEFNALIEQLRFTPSPDSPEASASAPSSEAFPASTSNTTSAKKSDAQKGDTTVRVDTQRLDDIMNMVGELVLVRNRLVRLGSDNHDEDLSKAIGNLDVVTADLQSSVMMTRMQPIKKVFGRFPRVVRDLARSLDKEVHLELSGEDTDLDKNLVEALVDPLVHLVRNAVDHGIESPQKREAIGKSRIGNVSLSAEQEGDHILLSISDDGAGMDPEILRKKAVQKNIIDQDAAERLTDSEIFNLIFSPGFSTKGEISDISGRGVGMDVVKTKITHLNGSIHIDSTPGIGSRFSIKVPLTLAIMPTLMVMLEQQCFAFPLTTVNEIFHMDLTSSNTVDGQQCVTIRDKAVPLFHLKEWLVKNPGPVLNSKEAHVVIVSVGTQRVGLVVDQLVGQEEVVIKPLGMMLQGTPGMAGATITGDGTIALILDMPSLLKRYAGCVPA